MGFGWARMILFWVLVVLGVAYVIKLTVEGREKLSKITKDSIEKLGYKLEE